MNDIHGYTSSMSKSITGGLTAQILLTTALTCSYLEFVSRVETVAAHIAFSPKMSQMPQSAPAVQSSQEAGVPRDGGQNGWSFHCVALKNGTHGMAQSS